MNQTIVIVGEMRVEFSALRNGDKFLLYDPDEDDFTLYRADSEPFELDEEPGNTCVHASILACGKESQLIKAYTY